MEEENNNSDWSGSDDAQIPFLSPRSTDPTFQMSYLSAPQEETTENSRKRGRGEILQEQNCEEKTILKAQLDELFTHDPLDEKVPPICSFLLSQYFHISSGMFRPRQSEVCLAILQKKSTLAVCPTGWGKSLCYLFPMLVHRLLYEEDRKVWEEAKGHDSNCESSDDGPYTKFCVVVSPLISLMSDQAAKLSNISAIKSVVLSSQMTKDREERILDNLASVNSTIDIVFTSPERLIGCVQLRRILALQSHRVAFLCIDEVHCVSKWAFNFRPVYLCLHRILEWTDQKASSSSIRFLCLTATATANVFRHNLLLESEKLTASYLGAPSTKTLHDAIIRAVEELPKPLIVYVRSRVDADEIASVINSKIKRDSKFCQGVSNSGDIPNNRSGLVIRSYHAALTHELRSRTQRQFINDEIDVLVATVAFGMGIDKINIRAVVHAHAPSSLESYVQEIGRAGRDGKESHCRILFNPHDYYYLRSSIFTSYISPQETANIIHAMLQCPTTKFGERILPIPLERIALLLETHEEIAETILYMMVLNYTNLFKGIQSISPIGYRIISSHDPSLQMQTGSRRKSKAAKTSLSSVLHQVSAADPVYDFCKKHRCIENIAAAANDLQMSLDDFMFRFNDLVRSGAVTVGRLPRAYMVVLQDDFNELMSPSEEQDLVKAIYKDHERKLFSQVDTLLTTFSVLESPSHIAIRAIMSQESSVNRIEWKPPPRSLTKMEAVSVANDFIDNNRTRLQSKYEAVRALLGVMPKSAIKTGKFAGQIPLSQSWYTKSPYFGALREFDFSWILSVVWLLLRPDTPLLLCLRGLYDHSAILIVAREKRFISRACVLMRQVFLSTFRCLASAAAARCDSAFPPPSFYIPRMREESVPNSLVEASGLGSAHPLFTIASASCEYYALRLPLLKAGFKRVVAPATSASCNLIWGRSIPFRKSTARTEDGSLREVLALGVPSSEERAAHLKALSMTSYRQRFNHFPLSHRNIGCKKGLSRNIRVMLACAQKNALKSQVKSMYSFVPPTWWFPEEKNKLYQHFRDSPDSQFIWKPARGSCGRGIFLSGGGASNAASWERVAEAIDERKEMEGGHLYKHYVVQEYVDKPLLLEGRKMDLRLYVAVTSIDPLVVYLHEDGLVRLAAEQYNLNEMEPFFRAPASPPELFKHLTNFSVGRRHSKFTKGDKEMDSEGMEEGQPTQKLELKWSLQRLWDYIDCNYPANIGGIPASRKVKENIALCIVRTLMAVQPPLRVAMNLVAMPGQYFEVYGFDILLKDDLSPVLIEVNTLPSLESSSSFDYSTKSNVTSDLLNLSMMEPFERNRSIMEEISSNKSLIAPPSRNMSRLIYSLEEQQSKFSDRISEMREDVHYRLKDELQYARGFKRIFPPVAVGDCGAFPFSSSTPSVLHDIQVFSKLGLLSEKDVWALQEDDPKTEAITTIQQQRKKIVCIIESSGESMSNDLQNMSVKNVPVMTEDEEAALLAEYGVPGPYDDLLDLPADSKFRSDVSGLSVFLTGATIDEDDKQEEPTTIQENEELLRMPLRSLLVKHTSVFQSSAAPELLFRTTQALMELETGSVQPSSSSEGTAGTQTGKYKDEVASAQEKMTSLYTQCVKTYANDENSDVVVFGLKDGHDTLIDKTDALLAEADRILKTRRHFDPVGDDFFEKNLEEQKHLERALGIDEMDDFLDKEDLLEEDDTKELLLKAHEAHHKVSSKLAKEGITISSEMVDVDSDKGKRIGLREELLSMARESLFNFEFESTKEEKAKVQEWDTLVERAEVSLPKETPLASIPAPAPPLEQISILFAPLKSFAQNTASEQSCEEELIEVENALEIRDSVLENAAEKDVTVLIQKRYKMEEDLQARRGMTQVKLQPFEKLVNTLIPPAAIELVESVEVGIEEKPSVVVDAVSLKDPTKKAKVQLLMMEIEQKEFALMRAEDARMQHVMREIEEKMEHIGDLMTECENDYDVKRNYIEQDEGVEWKDILKRREDHLHLTLKAIELRQFQTSIEKANEAFEQYRKIALTIQKEESETFAEVVQGEIEERQLVLQHIEMKAKEEAAEKLRQIEVLKKRFMEEKERVQNTAENNLKPKTGSGCSTCLAFSSSRLVLLDQEQLYCRAWCSKAKKKLDALDLKLRDAVSISKPLRSILDKNRQSLAGTPKDRGVDVDDNCLTAERLTDALSLTISEAQKNPHGAPHYFHTLSLPLENITSVDYASLSKVVLTSSPTENKELARLVSRDVTISEWVRELDLSNNSIGVVHLLDLLNVFPFLTKIEFANNNMTLLSESEQPARPSSMRGITAAHQNAVAERVLVKELDISSNKLEDVEVIGRILSSSLEVLMAHNNLLKSAKPLLTCSKVQKLNLSKNKITTISELAPLLLLRELDVADNNIHSIDTIPDNNLLLEKLYLSRNPISQLPSNESVFLFLHELFLNNCGLDSLSWVDLPWMPCLTILHANGNNIGCISGISRCSRLTNLHLANNVLQTLKDLDPLSTCKRLTVVDVSGNPLCIGKVGPGTSNGESTTEHAEETCLSPMDEGSLISALPQLRELNNCLLPSRRYAEYLSKAKGPYISLKDLFWHSHMVLRELTDPTEAYQHAAKVISSDLFFGNLRNSADVLDIRGKQRVRAAVALEEELRQRMAESKRDYLPSVHRLSHLVAMQYQRERLHCLGSTLEYYRLEGDPFQYCNQHVVFTSYAQKALAAKEKRAKSIIAEWIYGRILIQKARIELKHLREAFQKSEQFRFGEAAKQIQRVGRGAIVRHRLRHIQKDDLMDDDDEDVLNMDFNIKEPLVPEDFRTIVGNVMQRLNPQTKDRFEVPESLSLLKSVAPAAPGRAGSAPEGASPGPRNNDRGEERPATGGPTDEEQWGTTVYQRILRKNEKREKERKQKLREEYMKDPLKVKNMRKRH
eukprot:gene5970-4279_t